MSVLGLLLHGVMLVAVYGQFVIALIVFGFFFGAFGMQVYQAVSKALGNTKTTIADS